MKFLPIRIENFRELGLYEQDNFQINILAIIFRQLIVKVDHDKMLRKVVRRCAFIKEPDSPADEVNFDLF